MTAIDPYHHPLLFEVSQGAPWADDFPAWKEWADEIERQLKFVVSQGELERFRPRLRGPAMRRDETFAELKAAYFLGSRCGIPIHEWEPLAPSGRRGDFVLGGWDGSEVFVEVKSPGWEAEIVESEGQNSPRLTQPKFIPETRSTAPWAAIRRAVAKAYPKMPDGKPTLLVVVPDTFIKPDRFIVDIALYCEQCSGYETGYLAEAGCFVGTRYENLGAVGVLTVEMKGEEVSYSFEVYRNPNALVTVPFFPFERVGQL